MLIPPLASKTPFYESQTLRSGWLRAAAALEDATELTIIGYSFPVTDGSMSALLASRLNQNATVTVIDYSAEVADRIVARFAPRRGRTMSGSRAVLDYVNLSAPHHVEWGVERLAGDRLVPRLFIDGQETPQTDLPAVDDLTEPDQWPVANRFARWVGEHYPHAAQQVLTSQRFDHPGGCAFSYEP